jgi:polyisoprenoid-binding protein YceI
MLRFLFLSLLFLIMGTAPVMAASYQIDPSHTAIYFSAAHFERTFMRGRFMGIKGQVEFDAARKSGSLDINIDPDTVDTGLRGLDGILKSSQFLDTKEFQFARFKSSRFEFAGEQLQAVHGDLTLHGVTLPIILKASRFSCGEMKIVVLRRSVCGGDFQTQIQRSAFGMRHALPDVGDTVTLEISVEAFPMEKK